MDENKVRLTGYAAGTRRDYNYKSLSPSGKSYVALTLNYLDVESTPERRENLAQLMHTGAWTTLLDQLRATIDQQGTQLKG